MTAGYKWRPLQRATTLGEQPKAVIETAQKYFNCGPEEALAKLLEWHEKHRSEYWINDLYQVEKSYYDHDIVQLCIRRRDGAPVFKDWRHFQRIKNQLVGEECEGMELYPAESRLQDTSNKYHIWCVTDPEFRFPVGFWERETVDQEVRGPPGIRQRAPS